MRLIASAAITLTIVSFPALGAATHPDFSGMWTRGLTLTTAFRSPPSGPGPVRSVLATGRKTKDEMSSNEARDAPYRQGDDAAPILQPWAAAIVRAHAEAEHEGKPVRGPKETCSPMGVPYILELNQRAQIINDGKQIVFLYEQLMQPRIVPLDSSHSANLKPTWYGDSVARWDGDSLVIDTIGLDKRSWVDAFGTPHTEKMHVVERYHLRGPDTLEVLFTVEDPDAFTTPWSAIATYRKDRTTTEPFDEIVCAENDREGTDFFPIPTAQPRDF